MRKRKVNLKDIERLISNMGLPEYAQEILRRDIAGEQVSIEDRICGAGARYHGELCDCINAFYGPSREQLEAYRNRKLSGELLIFKLLFGGLEVKGIMQPKGVHRGIHESVGGSKRIIPVFYNGCGWADVGERFYKAACKKYKLLSNDKHLRDFDLVVTNIEEAGRG